MLILLSVFRDMSDVVNLGRWARGHFVTLIEICVLLMKGIFGHICRLVCVLF